MPITSPVPNQLHTEPSRTPKVILTERDMIVTQLYKDSSPIANQGVSTWSGMRLNEGLQPYAVRNGLLNVLLDYDAVHEGDVVGRPRIVLCFPVTSLVSLPAIDATSILVTGGLNFAIPNPESARISQPGEVNVHLGLVESGQLRDYQTLGISFSRSITTGGEIRTGFRGLVRTVEVLH